MERNENPQIPLDVMQRAQAEMEMRGRVQRVAKMIQTLLEKEHCQVVPSLTITPQGHQFAWDVVALPLENKSP